MAVGKAGDGCTEGADNCDELVPLCITTGGCNRANDPDDTEGCTVDCAAVAGEWLDAIGIVTRCDADSGWAVGAGRWPVTPAAPSVASPSNGTATRPCADSTCSGSGAGRAVPTGGCNIRKSTSGGT